MGIQLLADRQQDIVTDLCHDKHTDLHRKYHKQV